MNATRLCLILICSLLLGGCAQTGERLGYYWQSLRGHVALMQAARPIDEWLLDPTITPQLRARLELAQRARSFATTQLALPDNASYRRYAHLTRPYAVWNVVAAPALSLELHRWCFPIVGCIGYRGYFAQAEAQAEAARLTQQGLEASVYGVPAYSTLGYSNWLGGDPLLSTFLGWPEGDFVRLLFHELAHQRVYAEGDTQFNESYATAVARMGVALWLGQPGKEAMRHADQVGEQRRAQWRALTQKARARLAQIYTSGTAQNAQLAQKDETMRDMRAGYARLRAQWLTQGVTAGQLQSMDTWMRDANNASLAAQAAYDDKVDAFIALFAQEGHDWSRFHTAVQKLASLPQPERAAALDGLQARPAHQLAGKQTD